MFAAYSGCKISNFFVINQKFTLIFPLTHTFFHIYFVPLQRENNNTLNTNNYFMINSQVLWGDYDTMPGLAIYQLLRPENAKFVTVIKYVWNGKEKVLCQNSC